MTEQALVPREWENVSAAEVIERVVINGDLAQLTPEQRVAYYARVCESLGLNPFTRPFDYIRLKGRDGEPAKMILYAKRDATDQIRRNLRINVTTVEPAPPVEGLYGLIAHVRTPDGREDTGTAYVNVKGFVGEFLANALMKCETKAKRRATLSIAGLGIIDESEVSSIPDGELVAVDDAGVIKPGPVSVSDVIAARVAAIEQAETASAIPETASDAADAGVELTERDDVSDAEVTDAPAEPEPLSAALTGDPDEDEQATDAFIGAVVAEDAPKGRAIDLMAFASFVASVGAIVDRDEVRAIAQQMFPDATGFRMLSDEQRGRIADEIDRRVAERATDDDAEQEDETEDEISDIEGLPEDVVSTDLCGDPSPYGGGTVCDRDKGHDGPHGSGNNETW